MNQFFERYSYSIVKMFLNQFAIGLFGAVLALATSGISNTFLAITSVGAMIFYLFLLYTVIWEVGSKDRISSDAGKIGAKPYFGFVLSFIANIPSFLVATVYTVCYFISLGEAGVATNIAGAMRIVTLILNGMYYGLMTVLSCGTRVNTEGLTVPNELFNCWWAYFIIIIPAVLVCGLGYWLGTRNFHLTKMMETPYPESDREPKIKKDKKGNDR